MVCLAKLECDGLEDEEESLLSEVLIKNSF
jgi:hypothetical protein